MSNPTSMAASRNSSNPFPLWRGVLRLIADRNPFYLISAACMLWGCLAMTNSHSWSSVPMPRLIVLIATINVYEAMLIGLALLLRQRGLFRDGNILLVLQAFFLLDVTFLSAEIATANFAVGVGVNLAVLLLAAVKLRLVSAALPAGLTPSRQAHVLIQLAVLLAIPSVLRHVDHGSVPAGVFYALWWVVGLMPVIGEIIRRLTGEQVDAVQPATARLRDWPAGLYVLLPWISQIAHMGILHYVYDITYFGAMAAPVLLGLTFLIHTSLAATQAMPFRALPENLRQWRILRALLPAIAVLVSLSNPHELALGLQPLAHGSLSTTMLAVAGAYLTYIYCLFPAKAPALLAGGAAAGLVAVYGPSAAQLQRTSNTMWDGCSALAARSVPTTLMGWGVLSVIASFAFLALGAAISLAGGRSLTPAASVQGGEDPPLP